MIWEQATLLKWTKYFEPQQIDYVLETYCLNAEKVMDYRTKVRYYNIPCAFDIETSSFYRNNEKQACMYVWQLGLNGACILGRTWEEFLYCMNRVVDVLHLWDKLRLIIGVHNLAYEFQFIRKYFEWDKVFALDLRKPAKAITSGLEFRCTYLISGYSLEKLGEELQKYKVEKLTGELDYTLPRHSKTVLTEIEIQYCLNDIKVVMAYLQEQIEELGNVTRLPLTNTGRVRTYCRNECFYTKGIPRKKDHKRQRYKEVINALTLEPKEYEQLKRGFQGGYTHASAFISGKVLENISSIDFTSSYPYVMISEKFPMSKGQYVQITSRKQFYDYLNKYCCLFDVEFTGLETKFWQDNYISASRCTTLIGATINNGRVVNADRLITTLTEQDFWVIQRNYKWKHMKVVNFCRYRKGYLPTDFVNAILKLYRNKTMLKGVKGKEVEYLRSKGMVNACFGMTVTDICRDTIIYTDEWGEPIKPDIEKELKKYNTSPGRFLFYPWGVW